jgi:hypothetical protein
MNAPMHSPGASESDRLKALLLNWRYDPVLFVRQALKAQPEAWQLEALQALVTEDRLSIKAGHGVGKSTFLSWAILWFLLTRYPAKVPCTSPSAHQLFDVLWAEVTLWARKLPEALANQISITSTRIELAGAPLECFASARTARKEAPDALQGFHSENLLFVVDEASGVEDVIFEVASGSMSTKGAKLILTGNPLRAQGYFWRSHQLNSGFKCMTVSSESVPRAASLVSEIERNYGKDSSVYRVRVLGEFPLAGDDQMIPFELVTAAAERQIEVPRAGCVWGVDVARFGDDSSVLVKRFPRGVIEEPKVWSGLTTMELAGRIKHEYDSAKSSERPEKIYVDAIGIGAGVADRLSEMQLPVMAVNVSENPALMTDTAYRMRDELWVLALRWFESRECTIVNDQRLINELTALRKSFASNGKIRVESKDDLRKRGLRSPDVADAFCLTFAFQHFAPGKGITSSRTDPRKPISREATYA